MRWRRWLHLWHRDVGYLSAGLLLVYAISGVAVNHREDWNYNHASEVVTSVVGRPVDLLAELAPERRAALAAEPSALTDEEEAALVRRLGEALGKPQPPRNRFWRGPNRLSLFYGAGERDTVDYHPKDGTAEHQLVSDRFLLRDLNFLHLNEGRKLWTYLADLFAVALAFLAISGSIMLKGRVGISGRGGLLVAIGVAVPLLGLLLMRSC